MLQKFRNATDTLRELFFYYIALIGISAAAFSMSEGISFGEGLYWAGVTASTLGYGDISPHTFVGQVVSVLLVTIAVFVLGPLIIARILAHVSDDRDVFTHEEQEQIKRDLKIIRDNTASLLDRSKVETLKTKHCWIYIIEQDRVEIPWDEYDDAMDSLDADLRAGRFEFINQYLLSADPDRLSPDSLTILDMNLFSAKDKISSYSDFRKKVSVKERQATLKPGEAKRQKNITDGKQ